MKLSADTQGQSPLILVIDDMPEAIQPFLLQVHALGWRLSVASESRQGLQRALALRPDLILLDVRMPQMDGFTLCRLLRESPATRATPVIFLTAAGSLEERLEGLGLGGVDYVLKPFEPAELIARIRIHLQLARRGQPDGTERMEGGPTDPDRMILQAAMRLIGRQLDDLPSLAEIARQVGTHDKRLSAIFRQHLGTTVFAYIRDTRLRKAQELLADSTMSMQDIAELVGFRSACNFTTAFRERQGITPSQFRQQMQAAD